MNYPRDIEEKLGFDRVIEILLSFCHSDLGREQVRKISFSKDYNQIRLWLDQVHQMWLVKQKKGSFKPGELFVTKEIIKAIEVQGSYVEIEDLAKIKHHVSVFKKLVEYVGHLDYAPSLGLLFTEAPECGYILTALEAVINDENELKENASKEYAKTCRGIQNKEREILKKANHLLSRYIEQNYVAQNELSIKDGRLVVPVLAEHKRKVPGIITDESSGGKIYYIEPLEVVHISNELTELILRKRQEEIKILKHLADQIRPHRSLINAIERKLALYDMIQSKASFMDNFHAAVPQLVNEPRFTWKEARHPLLIDQLKDIKQVVPLSCEVDGDQRIILISGPNAGGKSVTLKTVLLGQYLIQCGIPFPCDEQSEVGVFNNLMVNIGDDQSIENDLSTYSSHLISMKEFLLKMHKKTLFCIDELGSGTDPQLGGPLAEAILEGILGTKGRGVITTHFSNLKKFAGENEGISNAGMIFDLKNLKPLYRLEVGSPGSSFSFEIAEKIGLPKRVIKSARKKVNVSDHKREQLLIELQAERLELELLKKEYHDNNVKAQSYLQSYRQLMDDVESNKKEILINAEEKALQIIDESNKAVERTIHDIKKSSAQKKTTKKVRNKLESKRQQLVGNIVDKKAAKSKDPIKVGDSVVIEGQQLTLEVIQLDDKKAMVSNGLIKTSVALDKLIKVKKTVKKQQAKTSIAKQMLAKQSTFSPQLDVRGKRLEEARQMMDRWLEDAFVLGAVSLRLIHGYGHGVLKEQLRTHLKQTHFVEKLAFEHEDRGGSGVTLISLKN